MEMNLVAYMLSRVVEITDNCCRAYQLDMESTKLVEAVITLVLVLLEPHRHLRRLCLQPSRRSPAVDWQPSNVAERP